MSRTSSEPPAGGRGEDMERTAEGGGGGNGLRVSMSAALVFILGEHQTLTNGCGSKLSRRGCAGFWSMFPLTRVPFWYRFFEQQPNCPRESACGI